MSDASLHNIAQSLLVPQSTELPPEVTEDTSEEPVEEQVEDVEAPDDQEDIDEGETDESDTDAEETDADEEADQDELEEQSDDKTDEPQILDLSDDDLIEVKIDGKVVQRTFGDALKALSGEGAIDTRVAEATREREEARKEREAGQQALTEAADMFMGTIKQFEDSLYTPLIPEPPADLKQRNPQQYIRHLEAYQQDQARLAEMKQKLGGTMAEFHKARQQGAEEKNGEEARLLTEKRPHLADREKGMPVMRKMINLAVSDYGFTQEQINSTMDHKVYMLLEDALKYKELTSQGKLESDEVVTKRSKAPRKLRSSTKRSRINTTSRAREQKAAIDTARKSGRPEDVAKTLLTRKK